MLQEDAGQFRDVLTQAKLNEDRFRILLQTIPDLIWLKDVNGVYLSCNAMFERFFGAREQDIIGKTDYDFVDKEQADSFREHDRKAMAAGGPSSNEEWLTFADDGHRALVETIKTPMRDDQGNIIGVLGIARDITERKRIENELRESKEKYDDILINAPIGIFQRTMEGGYTYFNTVLASMFECQTREEFVALYNDVASRWAEPDQLAHFNKLILANGVVRDFEIKTRLVSGKLKWFLLSVRLDATSNLLDGFVLDITKRKQIEEALRTEKDFNQSLIQLSPAFFVAIEQDSSTKMMNESMLRTLGYRAEEVVGRNYASTFVPEEDRQELHGVFRRIVMEGDVTANVNRILAKDGRVLTCEWRGVPVSCADGQDYFFGVGIDITERIKAEEELRESERKARAMFDLSFGFMGLLTPDGRLIEANRSALESVNVPLSEVAGKFFWDTPWWNHSEEMQELLRDAVRLAAGGELVRFEATHPTAGGTIQIMDISLKPVMDEKNQVVFLIPEGRDITAIKQAEEEKEKLHNQLIQAQKLEAIGTLAGGIAHDFNNILGAIMGHAQLLQIRIEMGETPDWSSLDEILVASDRAKDLVRQILAFSRRADTKKQPVRLDLIVKEALKLMRGLLPANIEFDQCLESCDGAVLADVIHMHQVITNLFTNAAHAMKEKGGVLGIRVHTITLTIADGMVVQGLPAGDYVELVVSDTGCGIKPEHIDHIFEPFFTTKEQGEGTGLGLSVVHGIVHDHGGVIQVESEVGRGTAFSILLPLVNAPQHDEIKEKSLRSLPKGHERILVVDDDELLLQVVSKMLVALGYEVVVRSLAMAAYDLIVSDREYFDLVVTDLMMPKMTGIELCQKLLEAGAGVPMILTTGHSETIKLERAADIGFKGLLQKPLGIKELAACVRRVLDEEQ